MYIPIKNIFNLKSDEFSSFLFVEKWESLQINNLWWNKFCDHINLLSDAKFIKVMETIDLTKTRFTQNWQVENWFIIDFRINIASTGEK